MMILVLQVLGLSIKYLYLPGVKVPQYETMI